ncbi:MAG: GNAT family N-acetyltransferase [Pseudonocardiaceae bacterium]
MQRHLRSWLGSWPPREPFDVIGDLTRTDPGWDGRVHPAVGVGNADDGDLLSVPVDAVDEVRAAGSGLPEVLPALPGILGVTDRGAFTAVFRWSEAPARLADAGVWVPSDAPGVPEWLHPFRSDVLVATDAGGAHLGGVGLKHHDVHGRELAVVVTRAAQGRGLARRLVAQAARRVLDEGAVPTYLHDAANSASARVAAAAGFPDLGWRAFGIGEAPH